MIRLTVPHPTDPGYDERHGMSAWTETLTVAPRVYQSAGLDIRGFDGRRSGDCREHVRQAVELILADPHAFIGVAGYYDLIGITVNLTRLVFMLGEREDGTVRVGR